MRGLLVKDARLALTNGRLFVIVIFIGVMTFLLGSNMAGFFVGYVTLIFSFQVCTTISYDTFEHADAFLMTLPVTRKMYVVEKYVFGFLCSVVGWGMAFLGECIFLLTRFSEASWTEVWTGSMAILAFGLLLVGICIPIQLKFGGDNGKMVIVAITVAAMVIGFLLIKLIGSLGIDFDRLLEYALVSRRNLSFAAIAGVLAIVYLISFFCSLRVMEHKEF